MNSAIERLLSLRVADVMKTNVVTVSANQTLAEAAEAFLRHQISGAPVVDEHGVCVGILSASDFVRWESLQRSGERPCLAGAEHNLVRRGASQALCSEDVAQNMVRDHMSPAIQTVSENATLVQAARIMCADHVHRLPVLHDNRHPVGILTSLDLVAAMLQAIDE